MTVPPGRRAADHLVQLLIRPGLLRDPDLRLLASRLLEGQDPDQIARDPGWSRRAVALRIEILRRLRPAEEAP